MLVKPKSTKELAREGSIVLDHLPQITFYQWLNLARSVLIQADTYYRENDFENAYTLYSRYASIVLELLPEHPEANKPAFAAQNRRIRESTISVLEKMEAIKPIIEQRVAAYDREMAKRAQRDQKMQHEKHKQLELQHREYVRRQSQIISDEEHRKTVRDIQELQKSLQANDKPTSSNSALNHTLASPQQNPKYHSHIPSYPSANYKASPIPKFDLKPLTPDVGKIPPELPQKPTIPQFQKHDISSSSSEHERLTSLPQLTTPSPPPKQITPEPVSDQKPEITNKIRVTTEGGEPLRTIFLPERLRKEFLAIAEQNTRNKLETCGMLCGKLNRNAFFITKLVIPHQESTPDTCATIHEEILFEYLDTNDLILIGWIHTHPTQSCFMSSVDLHTQNSYQIMLKESIAIVCAPTKSPSWDIFRLTDPTGMGIIRKCMKSSFHPHPEPDLYRSALAKSHVVLTRDIPFQIEDLRKIKPEE